MGPTTDEYVNSVDIISDQYKLSFCLSWRDLNL